MFCFNTQPFEYKYSVPGSNGVPNGMVAAQPLTPDSHRTNSIKHNRSISLSTDLISPEKNKRNTVVLSPVSFTPPLLQEDLTDHNHELIAAKKKQNQEKQLVAQQQLQTPKFTSTDNNEPLLFGRVTVEPTIERSLLTSDLRPNSIINTSPNTKRPPLKTQLSPRNETVSVLVPHKYGGVHRLNINLSQKMTVQTLLPLVLQMYKTQTGLEPVMENPELYTVRTVEEEGMTDGTVLDPSIAIRAGMKLVLTYERSQPMMLTPQTLPCLTDIRLRVLIPPGKHEHLVPIHPDLLLRDLNKTLCNRFYLDHTKYTTHIVLRDGKYKPLHKSMRERTMKSLKTITKVAIVKSENEEDVIQPTSPQPYVNPRLSISIQTDVLPFDFDAMQYREYRVIKTNKFGRKQERLLGIDADMLYNKKPSLSSLFPWGTNKDTKHPLRKIEALTQVSCNTSDAKNARTFVLKFNDDKTLAYEAKTQIECDGIVRKLTYLMQLKKQESGVDISKRKSMIFKGAMLGDIK